MEANALSTKEVWLEFSGTNDCEVSFCADGIPSIPLAKTLNYFKDNQQIIDNVDYVAIADFNQPSTQKRLYILNLRNGSVEKLLVTHGKKSEGQLAMAQYFSNVDESNMSSLGFYVTDSLPYIGKHGKSLRLTGLSKTNSNARKRTIVIHGADYATQWFVDERKRLGLSEGCPAVAPDKILGVIKKLQGRALLYIHSDIPSL
jgi:hypothetical protein